LRRLREHDAAACDKHRGEQADFQLFLQHKNTFEEPRLQLFDQTDGFRFRLSGASVRAAIWLRYWTLIQASGSHGERQRSQQLKYIGALH